MPTTTTKTKCPVCNEEITGAGLNVDVQGTSVKVCCDECAAEVRDNPSRFAKGSPNP